jgi:hypothetical protein
VVTVDCSIDVELLANAPQCLVVRFRLVLVAFRGDRGTTELPASGVFGALLGPEGIPAPPVKAGVMVLSSAPDRSGRHTADTSECVAGAIVWLVLGWLFENYTVDASIFVASY